ncbi:putative nucleotidyltransferase substrate binding domain-containing protein [Thioalkalivibrio sp. XN8]|uniref:putative nucleotidyltransferase substrate binding domain-containing protein n=1 Tax=Thioalkalivibrio sp. XN8 TaxID=2712863 RepID=UPI0013EAB7B0|nr:putative nucleotidyltransferase substrate binding domain-containing protein [Thioalkalivibrio sp. XN8]NGP53530.1 CBS domain-containing protein [Thioalkalivibrio sp. XN8]
MRPAASRAFLANVAPFSELPGEEIERLIGAGQTMNFHAGEAVGQFSQPGDHGLYVIVAGAAVLKAADGRPLEQRGEGELFGHAVRFDGAACDYAVEASEELELLYLPAATVADLGQRHPRFARFFSDGPGARLREAGSYRPTRLGELPLRAPITGDPDRSISETAALMSRHQVSCAPLLRDGTLVGIVTDRDLRNRVLGRSVDPERPVSDVMTPDPITVLTSHRIEDALLEMMRLGIHHLPVMGEDGRLASVISSGDLLRQQSPHPLRLVRDIQRAENTTMVAQLGRQGPGMLAVMARLGSQVTEVGRVASMITDACTRRLLALAQEQLGEAPMAWTWMAFGSQARLEQGLISDQDNGLLLAESPTGEAAEYFRKLAEFVCDGLNECGYVYCPGGVMAKGEWRMGYADWRKTFSRWILEPKPKSVMHSSIFFDMRGVAGDLAMPRRLQSEVLQQASQSKIFRRFLAAESMGHRPPLGLFRQFVQEHDGEKSQGLNLKTRGVIPIVDLARVRALEGAITAVHTEERLRAAGEQGIMNERDADDLIHALRFIGNVRLRHQVALYDRGEKPNHLVDPDELSGLHRRYLRSAFGIVRTAQEALSNRYQV